MAAEPLAFVLRYVRQLVDAESLTALPDGQLLERFVLHGSDAAFAALVERYGALVLGVCRRVLWNTPDVEDAFQATFLTLARRASALDRRGPIGNWLHTVAYHIAIQAKAGAARRQMHERTAGTMRPTSQQGEGDPEEWHTILDEELQRLPRKYRLPLILCYLQGKTNAQAAAELGWPAGSMSRRLTRARELLRQGLARRGVSLPASVLGTVVAGEGTAGVPSTLLATAARAAVAFGRGQAIAEGAASARAIVWADTFLKGIVMTRLKVLSGVLLVAGLVAGGALGWDQFGQRRPVPVGPSESARDRSVSSATPVPQSQRNDRILAQTQGQAQGDAPQKPVRLPFIKLLEIVDASTVRLRMDNALVERLNHDGGILDDRHFIEGETGQVKLNPKARPADEITLTTGEACMIGLHKFLLVKVEEDKAVIHHTGRTRRNEAIEETIDVAAYADAAWETDPKDPTRVTYTEFDASRRKRLQKHYHQNRLDGTWTQWYDNGQKEVEYHFVNGQRDGLYTEWYPTGEKRYEVRYRKDRKVGRGTGWSRDGSENMIEDNPEQPEEQSKSAPAASTNSKSAPRDGAGVPAQVRLESGQVPLGSLGYPLGDYLTVEGTREPGRGKGPARLLVDTINGKKLKEPVAIGLSNITSALPEKTRIIIKGYETGEMIGIPDAAENWGKENGEEILSPQAGWSWHARFVVLSAVKPKLEIQLQPASKGFKTMKEWKEEEKKGR